MQVHVSHQSESKKGKPMNTQKPMSMNEKSNLLGATQVRQKNTSCVDIQSAKAISMCFADCCVVYVDSNYN